MQDSSDDELFVGLGDLSAAVDDDTAADVAEPSSTELDAFRTVELACLEGRRINTDAGAALATASGWYAIRYSSALMLLTAAGACSASSWLCR